MATPMESSSSSSSSASDGSSTAAGVEPRSEVATVVGAMAGTGGLMATATASEAASAMAVGAPATQTASALVALVPAVVLDGVRIMKRDRVQDGSEAYLFGVEVTSDCKVRGAKRRTTVTSEHAAHLRTQHELPLKNGTTCRLLESLSVVDDGSVMRQNFFATNVKTGNTCAIDRFFNRTEPLSFDAENDDDDDDD